MLYVSLYFFLTTLLLFSICYNFANLFCALKLHKVVFNDAIKSVTQDKERVIEDLRLRVELLTDETEKLRRLLHNAANESTDQFMTALASENQGLKVRYSSVFFYFCLFRIIFN